ncbi:MAG: UDP-N-acetylglucosamine 4,6-dehydratase (inverting) [Cyclobacteriaceae bacterium]|nr:UDP-N-acetylglucosamine 4,6-dehydratase (inverting) [Cyclobacteriaceae bacterium]
MIDLSSKSILITGGTGSFGQKFAGAVLEKFPDIHRLVVFSRDELKQYEMAQKYPKSRYDGIRYFLGDVRDKDRLLRAFEDIDLVIHAAALKQVPAAEYNPFEFIKTNIIGAENVISAALDKGVKTVINLSTDKAAAPINLYGATKLCADKLFIAANNIKGGRECKFTIVRYGNVIGSRGSVIPLFLKQRKNKTLSITDPEMTRFSISLNEGISLVFNAIEKSLGGEIIVPKIPSFRILDVAKAISPEAEIEYIGIRPGEKIHEEMITEADAVNTIDIGDYLIILPTTSESRRKLYLDFHKGLFVDKGFSYNSGNNDQWLSVEDIRELIKIHINPNFTLNE